MTSVHFRSIALLAVSALILFYQFLPVAHFVAPYTLAGKNVYIIAPAVMMSLLLVIFWPGIARTSMSGISVGILGMLLFMWFCVWLARSAFYGEDGDVLAQRFVVLLFIYSVVFMHLARDPAVRESMAMWIVVASVVQAVIGIVHAHFFSHIQLVPDQNNELVVSFSSESTREIGTLVSSSLYAGVIVCGQFVLLGEKRLSFALKLALMCLMTYAATLSGGRYPIAVSCLLTAGVFMTRRVDRTALVALGIAAVLGVMILAGGGISIESKGIMRFGEDSGARFDKLFLGIDMILDNWRHALIGVPDKVVQGTSTAAGFQVSDNSYVLLALRFGVPLLFVWLACSVELIVRRPAGMLAGAMILYFFLNLGLTNSILWEPWLFYFLLAFWIVSGRTADTASVDIGVRR